MILYFRWCQLCSKKERSLSKVHNHLWLQIGYKILKMQRKKIFLENMMTEMPENKPFVTQASSNLIREGGRTVESGKVATIIE